ncbi:TRAP transporter substrate-binding protein [Marinobacterium arenosum]|uniref:TRAP transporter substrate-binding protein n=1 Tax=Marinobacterium arenosum TaxID=2862496 RepID=UPI001C959606|nr:TRAP transporter substrate-binding protein DctP [Marinobacterium arenosum]MBY4678335.1 TRAP transporter substrate-binding protein DctP [Marinobacterium arenosum]
MFVKRLNKALACGLVLGMGLAVQGVQAATWKIAIEEIPGSIQEAHAKKLGELLEQKSGGDIKLKVFPFGTLGDSADTVEMVANGVLQFTTVGTGHVGSFVPEIQVLSVPYLLSDRDAVNKQVLKHSKTIYDDLDANFRQSSLKLMSVYPEGEMVWTTRREIRKPADFANFKMRIMASPMLTETYRQFGANPTPLPFSEVYGALQLSMVDGQENPVSAIEEMKFYEVTDYMIWPGHQQFTAAVLANPDWFDELSEQQQKLVKEAMDEAADYVFDYQKRHNAALLEKIKAKKPDIQMIELSDQERAAFRQRAQVLQRTFVEMVGPGGQRVLDGLVAEIKQAEQQ